MLTNRVYADNIADITNKFAISHEHLSDNDLPKPLIPEDIIEDIRQKFETQIKAAKFKKKLNRVRELEHYRNKFEFLMGNVPEGFALASMLYSKPNKSFIGKSKIYIEQIKSGYLDDTSSDCIPDNEKKPLKKEIRKIFSKQISLVKGKKAKKTVVIKELEACRDILEELVPNIPKKRVTQFLHDLKDDSDVVKEARKYFKDNEKTVFIHDLARTHSDELRALGICDHGIDCMLADKNIENDDELTYQINVDHIIDLSGCGTLGLRGDKHAVDENNQQLMTVHIHDGFKNKLKSIQNMLQEDEIDEQWIVTLAPLRMENRSGLVAFPQKKGTPFSGIQLVNKRIPNAARYTKSLIKKINKDLEGKDRIVKGDVTYGLEKSIKKLTTIFKRISGRGVSKNDGKVLKFVFSDENLKSLFNKVANSKIDIVNDLVTHFVNIEEKRLNKGKKYRQEQKPQIEQERQKDKDEKKKLKDETSLSIPENIVLDRKLVKLCRQEVSLLKLHERERKELAVFQKSLKRLRKQDPDDKKNAYESNLRKAVKRELTEAELQEIYKFKEQKETSEFSGYLKQKFENRKKEEVLKLLQQKEIVGGELKAFLEKESLLVKDVFDENSASVVPSKKAEAISKVDEDFQRNCRIFNEKFKSKKKIPETRFSLLEKSLKKLTGQKRSSTEDYKVRKKQLVKTQAKIDETKIKVLNTEECKLKKDIQKELGRDLSEKELRKIGKAFKRKYNKFKEIQKYQMQRFNDDHKQVMKIFHLKRNILKLELQEQQTPHVNKPIALKPK